MRNQCSWFFLSYRDAEELSRKPMSSTIVQYTANDTVCMGFVKEWNVTFIISGAGSSGLNYGTFYGFGAVDGSVGTFWALDWDYLTLSFRLPDASGIIYCTYKPVI